MNESGDIMSANENWVLTWGQSHSSLSLFHYPSAKKTYRLVIDSAISGKSVRVYLSNRFGSGNVSVGKVTAALCNEEGTVYSDFREITFSGKSSFVIKKGEKLQSDPADIDVKAGYHFCISVFVEKGDLASGNLLDNVLLVTANGDKTQTKNVPNERRTRDGIIDKASDILGMHFPRPIPLFDSVELLNCDNASAIVVFGDSISQQGFWVNPFEQRIREKFPGRYSVINRSVMGNRLLRDCSPFFVAKGLYGKKASTRIAEDVYPYENISHVILFMGINDICQYGSLDAPTDGKPDLSDMADTVKQFADEIHKKGSRFIFFDVLGFGAANQATDEKNALRKEFNNMMRNNRELFDGFYDIAKVGEDPENDNCTRAEFVGADKLHPNANGGKYFADNIDLSWFE